MMVSRVFQGSFALLVATFLMVAACKPVADPPPEPAVAAATGTPDASIPPSVPLETGRSRFVLQGWGGPDLPVWTYVPIGRDVSDLPIVIVMHGVGRDADRYRDEWSALAQLEGFIVAAPEFSRQDWPEATDYNLGAIHETEGGAPRPEAEWAFSAIEPVFDAVVARTGSRQADYVIYGHSAGSQFVHRFLFYMPDVRAKRYIVANAGWYTMPDFDEPYPYGLGGSDVPESHLTAALEKDVVVLLGTQDINPEDPSLRRTPEAMRQGPYRFARGQAFFAAAQEAAAAQGVDFNWQMATVEGAVHSNGQMAFGAVPFIVDPVFLAVPPAE